MSVQTQVAVSLRRIRPSWKSVQRYMTYQSCCGLCRGPWTSRWPSCASLWKATRHAISISGLTVCVFILFGSRLCPSRTTFDGGLMDAASVYAVESNDAEGAWKTVGSRTGARDAGPPLLNEAASVRKWTCPSYRIRCVETCVRSSLRSTPRKRTKVVTVYDTKSWLR